MFPWPTSGELNCGTVLLQFVPQSQSFGLCYLLCVLMNTLPCHWFKSCWAYPANKVVVRLRAGSFPKSQPNWQHCAEAFVYGSYSVWHHSSGLHRGCFHPKWWLTTFQLQFNSRNSRVCGFVADPSSLPCPSIIFKTQDVPCGESSKLWLEASSLPCRFRRQFHHDWNFILVWESGRFWRIRERPFGRQALFLSFKLAVASAVLAVDRYFVFVAELDGHRGNIKIPKLHRWDHLDPDPSKFLSSLHQRRGFKAFISFMRAVLSTGFRSVGLREDNCVGYWSLCPMVGYDVCSCKLSQKRRTSPWWSHSLCSVSAGRLSRFCFTISRQIHLRNSFRSFMPFVTSTSVEALQNAAVGLRGLVSININQHTTFLTSA